MPSQKNKKRHHGRRGREIGTRDIRQRFLIVCEGEETESTYFRAFQTPGLVVAIEPAAGNTIQVVERAIMLRDEGDFDQLWCVFDRDDFPIDHCNAAFRLAQQEGIEIAFSNEAFELWYLLHFDYINTAMSRQDYMQGLSRRMGQAYSKNHRSMYELLEQRQPEATGQPLSSDQRRAWHRGRRPAPRLSPRPQGRSSGFCGRSAMAP